MSTAATELKTKARAKAGYFLADGTRVPSVTTILSVIAKPALIKWANRLGLQGIDSTKYTDALASVGTLTHDMIPAHIKGTPLESVTTGYDQATVDLAENCFLSYLSWEKGKAIEPILLEKPLVSKLYRYGGKFDFYGRIEGTLTLVDFKTGSGVWPEHFYQMAAYRQLLIENGYEAPAMHSVLNIPRKESEAFDIKSRAVLEDEFKIFLAAKTIYDLTK